MSILDYCTTYIQIYLTLSVRHRTVTAMRIPPGEGISRLGSVGMAPQNSVFGGERGQRQSSSFWPPGTSGMDVVGWSAHSSPIFASSASNPSHASSESCHPCSGIQHIFRQFGTEAQFCVHSHVVLFLDYLSFACLLFVSDSVFTCVLFCALHLQFSKTVAPYSAPTALLDAIQVLTRIILDTCTVFSLPALYNLIPPSLLQTKSCQ